MKQYIKPELLIKSLIQSNELATEKEDGLYGKEAVVSAPQSWWTQE